MGRILSHVLKSHKPTWANFFVAHPYKIFIAAKCSFLTVLIRKGPEKPGGQNSEPIVSDTCSCKSFCFLMLIKQDRRGIYNNDATFLPITFRESNRLMVYFFMLPVFSLCFWFYWFSITQTCLEASDIEKPFKALWLSELPETPPQFVKTDV